MHQPLAIHSAACPAMLIVNYAPAQPQKNSSHMNHQTHNKKMKVHNSNTHTPADWIRNGLESEEIHDLPEMLTHNSTPSCVTAWEED
jgi:hypothetical protein